MLAKSGGTIRETVIMDEPAGCAALYVVTGTDARVLKRKAVSLEETHPCGRLFDIDTLDSKGMPITREQVGSGKRTCLLCNRDAKVCGRSRTHSVEELTDQVWRMIEIWEQSR